MDINRENGEQKKSRILSGLGNECVLRYGDKQVLVPTEKGEILIFDKNLKK